ncbi:MAG: hypothetical protein FWC79_04285 [Oscillospiraceae bacterium]|nr:hypothetical protein [Oscillospiraceae bacterium]
MKKGSIMLLGYGLSYIILSVLLAFDAIDLSDYAIIYLTLASFIFALSEFLSKGFLIFIMSIFQKSFNYFAYRGRVIIDKKVANEKNSLKVVSRANKQASLMLSLSDQSIYLWRKAKGRLDSNNSLLSHILYIAGTFSLVLMAVQFDISNSLPIRNFEQTITLATLGIMLTNIFFESESTSFAEKGQAQTEKILEYGNNVRKKIVRMNEALEMDTEKQQ